VLEFFDHPTIVAPWVEISSVVQRVMIYDAGMAARYLPLTTRPSPASSLWSVTS
jgi:hypothetical protein